MDFNATIDLIIRELDEAREIVEDLKKIDGVPVLEIELARSKIRNAGEVIALLKEHHAVTESHRKEQSQMPEEQPWKSGQRPVEKKEETVAGKRDLKDEKNEPVVNITPRAKKAGPEERQDEHYDTPDEIPGKEKDPGRPEPESGSKPFVAPIIADTFSHLANRFNEQMGEQKGEDFSYTHGKHYASLIDAIGVNDRFYYIRELFDGDRDAYNEALSKLDNAWNMNEARELIKNYSKNKSSGEAAKHLLELVKRKFSPHE